MVIEYARNVLGLANANSVEFDRSSCHYYIHAGDQPESNGRMLVRHTLIFKSVNFTVAPSESVDAINRSSSRSPSGCVCSTRKNSCLSFRKCLHLILPTTYIATNAVSLSWKLYGFDQKDDDIDSVL